VPRIHAMVFDPSVSVCAHACLSFFAHYEQKLRR
jgi:hypothetical protein